MCWAKRFWPESFASVTGEQDGTIWLRETKVTQNWGWIESRWILVKGTSRQEFTVSHRIYSGTELSVLLHQCGFEPVRIFGSLEGTPYDQKAERLVAVVTKPPESGETA
jgi:hypothetical protein